MPGSGCPRFLGHSGPQACRGKEDIDRRVCLLNGPMFAGIVQQEIHPSDIGVSEPSGLQLNDDNAHVFNGGIAGQRDTPLSFPRHHSVWHSAR